MDACARQRLSKIAKAILVALTPQTQQVRVEDLGVMSKRRRDVCSALHRFMICFQSLRSFQLLMADSGDAAWNYCGETSF